MIFGEAFRPDTLLCVVIPALPFPVVRTANEEIVANMGYGVKSRRSIWLMLAIALCFGLFLTGTLFAFHLGNRPSLSSSELATKDYPAGTKGDITDTDDEPADLFLNGKVAWVCESPEGVAVKTVRMEIFQDGKLINSLQEDTEDMPDLTKVLAVINTRSHTLKLAFFSKHGSKMVSNSAWFTKPLISFGGCLSTQTELPPIRAGRTPLFAAATNLNNSVITSVPDRIELVIE